MLCPEGHVGSTPISGTMKKKHFYHGCLWADGSIQLSDTDQRFNWSEVTCLHCLRNKLSNGESNYWTKKDKLKFYSITNP